MSKSIRSQNYEALHPKAVDNVDKAHEMALAGDSSRSSAALHRMAGKMIVNEVLQAGKSGREVLYDRVNLVDTPKAVSEMEFKAALGVNRELFGKSDSDTDARYALRRHMERIGAHENRADAFEDEAAKQYKEAGHSKVIKVGSNLQYHGAAKPGVMNSIRAKKV